MKLHHYRPNKQNPIPSIHFTSSSS